MEEAFLQGHEHLTEKEARLLSPLRLAYVGDAVHELFVRTGLIFDGGKAGAMHRAAIRAVNAAGQARALERIEGQLTGGRKRRRPPRAQRPRAPRRAKKCRPGRLCARHGA